MNNKDSDNNFVEYNEISERIKKILSYERYFEIN